MTFLLLVTALILLDSKVSSTTDTTEGTCTKVCQLPNPYDTRPWNTRSEVKIRAACEVDQEFYDPSGSSDSQHQAVHDPNLSSTMHNSEMITSLAVIPYDENKILPHEKSSRQFHIAGHKFTIKQDWQRLGVAAVVWDSAVVLGEYLHQHQHLVKHKKVLELGAGTGLAGLVASALGADVTVTERAEAMEHLQSAIDSNKEESWRISAEVLDWTEQLDTERFNTSDVILGADIIYIEETFDDLFQTISSLASDSQVLVLLSCRIRYDRDLNFLSRLDEHFDIDEIFLDDERQIKIFSARRRL